MVNDASTDNSINEIKKTVHAHPTLSEIWYEAVKHL